MAKKTDPIRDRYNEAMKETPCGCCGMRHGNATRRGCCGWCTRHGRRR